VIGWEGWAFWLAGYVVSERTYNMSSWTLNSYCSTWLRNCSFLKHFLHGLSTTECTICVSYEPEPCVFDVSE